MIYYKRACEKNIILEKKKINLCTANWTEAASTDTKKKKIYICDRILHHIASA